jgi:hypothetical protein
VRAEEGGGDVDRTFVVEGEQSLQETQFAGGLEGVPGFDLGGGRAVGEHAQQTEPRLRHERFERCGARRIDRGQDSTACRENVEVVCAGHLLLKLGSAVPSPDDVRVRVHEAGHDDAAGGVEGRFVAVGRTQVGRLAGGDDLFILDEHGAIFDNVEGAELRSALGAAGEGQELGGRVDEHESVSSEQYSVISVQIVPCLPGKIKSALEGWSGRRILRKRKTAAKEDALTAVVLQIVSF